MSKSLLKRIGVSGYNKPKRTPNHPTKSHVVVGERPADDADPGSPVESLSR